MKVKIRLQLKSPLVISPKLKWDALDIIQCEIEDEDLLRFLRNKKTVTFQVSSQYPSVTIGLKANRFNWISVHYFTGVIRGPIWLVGIRIFLRKIF
jgi:hypothetical protein